MDKKENNENQMDEGAKEFISITFIASLLSVPGIVTAKEIEKNIPNNASYSQIQDGFAKTAPAEKIYGGYSALQLANIIARTLYGEAAGESTEGKKMIATVIVNRAGGDLNKMGDVCFAYKQFSVWNKFNNKTPASFKITVPKSAVKNPISKKAWSECQTISTEILAGKFEKLGTWNSYLNPKTASKNAINGWGKKMSNKKTVGKHKFGYLANNDGYGNSKKNEIKSKAKKYLDQYKVKDSDIGVSSIAKNLIKNDLTPIRDLKKLTDKIISLNKLNANATIHPNEILKLPLEESFRYFA